MSLKVSYLVILQNAFNIIRNILMYNDCFDLFLFLYKYLNFKENRIFSLKTINLKFQKLEQIINFLKINRKLILIYVHVFL